MTGIFDIKRCSDDTNQTSERSIIVSQVCTRNPSGVDPKVNEWELISDLVKKRNLFPFFDMAYQGFASGDIGRVVGDCLLLNTVIRLP